MSAPLKFDLTGQRFGLWLVLGRAKSQRRGTFWLARCDCGTERALEAFAVRSGVTKSCGCVANRVANRAPYDLTTRTYRSWISMRLRCNSPKQKSYRNYGARGVRVCERWNRYENFLADMGERPEGKTLDRYPDHAGNYEPGNCRWATLKEQGNNTRVNRILEWKGRRQTLTLWARELGLSLAALSTRLNKRKWTVDRALSQPMRKKGPKSRAVLGSEVMK